MLKGIALVLIVASCRDDDPGFEIVRVPQSAYVTAPDAGAQLDGDAAAGDAGLGPLYICIPQLDEPGEGDEVSEDYPSCKLEHEGRKFDKRITERHRNKDESEVCCYRRTR